MKKTTKTKNIVAVAIALSITMCVIRIIMSPYFFSRPEVTTDITKYKELRSGSSAGKDYQNKLGMDESIWPESITEDMDIKGYKMIYYNPWDPQYLGYLAVEYPDAEYKAEVGRLENYNSTEYKGYYGVTGEDDFKLLAVNADPYYGFVYAMTDEDNTIIYAEQLFCNGFMDLEYEKYMPEEYFLDGFDASEGNAYGKNFTDNMPDVYTLQGNPIE